MLIQDRSNQDIANQAVLEVSDRMLYDVENLRKPVQHGPLDTRLVTYFQTGVQQKFSADTGIMCREYQIRIAPVEPVVNDWRIAMAISVIFD